ncbi:MAG: Mini-ribonuclease 3 [Clostridia bacterium]|nr:Mini-ribonuclease 3 [Clostridia bacterium]
MEKEQKNSITADVLGALGRDKVKNPRLLNPLVLAYVGDTVYDLFVRSYLVSSSDAGVHSLHLRAAKKVCAAAQAAAFRRIENMLTEDELTIYKRGRNSHMGSVPKHASIVDYRTATGLETLVGFLYLCGDDERLELLMGAALCEEEI